MRYTTLLLLTLPFCAQAQNVGINATGAAPAASAILDVSSTTAGMLVPRMTAAQRTAIAAPATGLLVYQTDASGGIPANHFWYFDGTVWRPLFTDRTGWGLLGNAGTVATTNFLGTTDNVALRIRTNNTERFEFSTAGPLRAFANGTATAPAYSWMANTNTGLFQQAANVLGFSTNGTERMRIAANGHVGIGGAPANGAILDVQSTNRGVLIPRVALTALNSANPVGNANVVNGLLVFNTATAGADQNMVTPGFYRWDATVSRWYRLVDLIEEVWLVGPLNINANTTYTVTAAIPGVTVGTGVSVALSGNWPAAPNVTIQQVEARTGEIRFMITNNTATTNYLNMDWNVTITRY